jgi:hypothetical protein
MMIVSIVERSEFQVGITERDETRRDETTDRFSLSLVSLNAALHIAGQLKVLSESLMQIIEQQTSFIPIGLGGEVDLSVEDHLSITFTCCFSFSVVSRRSRKSRSFGESTTRGRR